MVVSPQTATLTDFLRRPETQPASEYFRGKISQKPMPQGEHSVLQQTLCTLINASAKSQKIAYAFPELRCVVGENAIVPDIAVFSWDRIPITESGRISNRFDCAPDWVIEILSPQQNQTKVLEKIVHCFHFETTLGWLLDPSEESITVISTNETLQVLRADAIAPVLSPINLQISVHDVFACLKFDP